MKVKHMLEAIKHLDEDDEIYLDLGEFVEDLGNIHDIDHWRKVKVEHSRNGNYIHLILAVGPTFILDGKGR